MTNNEATVLRNIGKTIVQAQLDNDKLNLDLSDGTQLILSDEGQSCCEYRYMVCDDDLTAFAGAKFLGITEGEHRDNPEGEYGAEHEEQFVHILTDRGSITLVTHNEHNGYYGGIWICLEEIDCHA